MATSPLFNQSFGSYILRDLIGGGGVAEVWRAEHRTDQQPVAVKVMRPERLADRFHVRSFAREQEVLRDLQHPGIPRIRHQGELAGRPGFALDFIPGQTLVEACKQRDLPRIQALSELCDIVEHLHSRNIVHNDLKLENVLWRTTGGVVLVDFGNVRRLGPVREITSMFLREPPRAFNTATYVAPELLTGGKATCASDVYALGVCAFLVLTGQPPFTDKTQSAKLRAHATATPPAIRGRIPTLPAAQAQVMDACLAKFASARPTARDLASAVRSLVRKIAPSLAAG
jgi:serine/threonine-protein kinase